MNKVTISEVSLEELIFKIKELITVKVDNEQLFPKEDFLSREETAKLVKISLPTLNQWTKEGILLSYRIGKRILYRKSEVEEAVQLVSYHKYKKQGL